MIVKNLKKIRKILLPHWTDIWSEIIQIEKSKKGLHIGPGLAKIENTISIDINPATSPDIVWDLNKTPWPIKNDTYDAIIAMNVMEHLNDISKTMDELHRISKPNAIINILVPHFSAAAAFVDPTHKSFFSFRTFDYFIGGKTLENAYGFYKNIRFDLIRADIHLAPKIQYIPFLLFLVKKFPKFWETYLCYIIRGDAIFFQLKVLK